MRFIAFPDPLLITGDTEMKNTFCLLCVCVCVYNIESEYVIPNNCRTE